MPIGASIGAAGALGAAGIGAYASGKASEAQGAAAAANRDFAMKQFTALSPFATPFLDTGFKASGQLQGELSGGPGSIMDTLKGLVTPGSAASVLSTMPGFQFQQQYGTQAVTNALAKRGLGGSTGPLARGIGDYVTGLAGTTWKDAVGALQNFAGLKIGSLQNAAGTGMNALQTLFGVGGNTTNAVTGANTAGGNAQAAGILGGANAASGGITGAANAATLPYLLNALKTGGLYGSPAVSGNPWSSGGTGTADYWGG